MKRMSISLPDNLAEQLDEYAAKKHLPKSTIIQIAIDSYFQQLEAIEIFKDKERMKEIMETMKSVAEKAREVDKP